MKEIKKALWHAVNTNNNEEVRKLLEKYPILSGSELNFNENGEEISFANKFIELQTIFSKSTSLLPPLFVAAKNGSKEIYDQLLQRNALTEVRLLESIMIREARELLLALTYCIAIGGNIDLYNQYFVFDLTHLNNPNHHCFQWKFYENFGHYFLHLTDGQPITILAFYGHANLLERHLDKFKTLPQDPATSTKLELTKLNLLTSAILGNQTYILQALFNHYDYLPILTNALSKNTNDDRSDKRRLIFWAFENASDAIIKVIVQNRPELLLHFSTRHIVIALLQALSLKNAPSKQLIPDLLKYLCNSITNEINLTTADIISKLIVTLLTSEYLDYLYTFCEAMKNVNKKLIVFDKKTSQHLSLNSQVFIAPIEKLLGVWSSKNSSSNLTKLLVHLDNIGIDLYAYNQFTPDSASIYSFIEDSKQYRELLCCFPAQCMSETNYLRQLFPIPSEVTYESLLINLCLSGTLDTSDLQCHIQRARGNTDQHLTLQDCLFNEVELSKSILSNLSLQKEPAINITYRPHQMPSYLEAMPITPGQKEQLMTIIRNLIRTNDRLTAKVANISIEEQNRTITITRKGNDTTETNELKSELAHRGQKIIKLKIQRQQLVLRNSQLEKELSENREEISLLQRKNPQSEGQSEETNFRLATLEQQFTLWNKKQIDASTASSTSIAGSSTSEKQQISKATALGVTKFSNLPYNKTTVT